MNGTLMDGYRAKLLSMAYDLDRKFSYLQSDGDEEVMKLALKDAIDLIDHIEIVQAGLSALCESVTFDELSEDEVDDTLRGAGYDPDEVGENMAAFARRMSDKYYGPNADDREDE